MKTIVKHIASFAVFILFCLFALSSNFASQSGLDLWPRDEKACSVIDPPVDKSTHINVTAIDPISGLGVSGVRIVVKVTLYGAFEGSLASCRAVVLSSENFSVTTNASGDASFVSHNLARNTEDYLLLSAVVEDLAYAKNTRYERVFLGNNGSLVLSAINIDEL